MIQSKEELKEYIEYESHGFSNKFPDSIIGEPQNFQKLLRKTEYYRNCRKDIFGKIVYLSYRGHYSVSRIKHKCCNNKLSKNFIQI